MSGLVERLIRVVASAFYSDECIIILEAMIREKFLKDDDRMGDAVNLQTRQVRKILAELQQDHMICSEVLNDKHLGGGSSTTYWYIDYKHFVNVVKYRLYKMNEFLKEREQEEMVRQIYRCGNVTCNREYTALEAQRLILPGQYEFCCGHCGDPLLECDNNERLVNIQHLQKKFKDEMNKSEGIHDGITEILRKLGEYVAGGHQIPRNLPSENRALGVGGEASRPTNARGPSVAGSHQKGGGGGSGGGAPGTTEKNAQSFLYPYGAQPTEIVVDIAAAQAEDDMLLGKRKQDAQVNDRPAKQVKAQPEFLQKSTISGHLTAAHEEEKIAEPVQETISQPLNGLNYGDATMTEEQRQEAFKKAYMEELMRYNSSKHHDDGSQQVQVQLEKEAWDMDENDDENDPDIEWEWCGKEEEFSADEPEELVVLVQGIPKNLSCINDDDKKKMSLDEYQTYYEICSA